MRRRRTILIAPNSFKKNIDSVNITKLISKGIRKSSKDFKTIKKPLSDGGDGSIETLSFYVKGNIKKYETINPLGVEIEAPIFWFNNNKSVFIEMASSSGLQVCGEKLMPMLASSHSTGILIRQAIREGAKNVYVGIGGTATTDLGCGLMQELGVEFYDDQNNPFRIQTGNIGKIAGYDTTKAMDFLTENKAEIFCVCDSYIPVDGEDGSAARTIQKGASLEEKEIIKNYIYYITSLFEKISRKKISGVEMLGCGGGTPAGLYALLNAKVLLGAKYFMGIAEIEKDLEKCDIVLTGEGRVDTSTFDGKLPYELLKVSQQHNKPVILMTGELQFNYLNTIEMGFHSVLNIDNRNKTLLEIIHLKLMPQILKDFGYNLGKMLTI